MSAEGQAPRRDIVIAATVIITAVITATTLAILADKSTTAIVVIVLPLVLAVLAFFGAKLQAGQQEIKTLSNGNNAALLGNVMELAKLLAAAQRVAPADVLPTTTTVTTTTTPTQAVTTPAPQ